MKFYKTIALAAGALAIGSPLQAATLSFDNPTLESGIGLMEGAVYRYDDVISGVDALVSVDEISDNAALTDIHTNIGDGMTKFTPEVQVLSPDGEEAEGYVNFTMTFVIADTSTEVVLTNLLMNIIDIDGDGEEVREFAASEGTVTSFGGAPFGGTDIQGNLTRTGAGPEISFADHRYESTTTFNLEDITSNVENRVDYTIADTSSIQLHAGSITTRESAGDVTNRLYAFDFIGEEVAVPEPAAAWIFSLGLAPLLRRRRR